MKFNTAKKFILNKLRNELPPGYSYHNLEHAIDVYDCCEDIAQNEGVEGDDLKLLLTAALFHDSGFIVQEKNHEEISCKIAQENLPNFGYNKTQIDQICKMIIATKIPQNPNNKLEEIIVDADLDYLGRDDFYSIGQRLFYELSMSMGITKKEWDVIQVEFLENHKYFTQTSNQRRNEKKENYLKEIKAKLNK